MFLTHIEFEFDGPRGYLELYLGYELSWGDSLLDVVNNFIQMVFQHAVLRNKNYY